MVLVWFQGGHPIRYNQEQKQRTNIDCRKSQINAQKQLKRESEYLFRGGKQTY